MNAKTLFGFGFLALLLASACEGGGKYADDPADESAATTEEEADDATADDEADEAEIVAEPEPSADPELRPQPEDPSIEGDREVSSNPTSNAGSGSSADSDADTNVFVEVTVNNTTGDVTATATTDGTVTNSADSTSNSATNAEQTQSTSADSASASLSASEGGSAPGTTTSGTSQPPPTSPPPTTGTSNPPSSSNPPSTTNPTTDPPTETEPSDPTQPAEPVEAEYYRTTAYAVKGMTSSASLISSAWNDNRSAVLGGVALDYEECARSGNGLFCNLVMVPHWWDFVVDTGNRGADGNPMKGSHLPGLDEEIVACAAYGYFEIEKLVGEVWVPVPFHMVEIDGGCHFRMKPHGEFTDGKDTGIDPQDWDGDGVKNGVDCEVDNPSVRPRFVTESETHEMPNDGIDGTCDNTDNLDGHLVNAQGTVLTKTVRFDFLGVSSDATEGKLQRFNPWGEKPCEIAVLPDPANGNDGVYGMQCFAEVDRTSVFEFNGTAGGVWAAGYYDGKLEANLRIYAYAEGENVPANQPFAEFTSTTAKGQAPFVAPQGMFYQLISVQQGAHIFLEPTSPNS